MNSLPFQRASQIDAADAGLTRWLVEGLWSLEAVGILGGEPKCCKSFLALDLAVSVASGTSCLRQFPVQHAGSVLLFPAEDALPVVRQRLEGICAAAQVDFASLPVNVITAPTLRLDTPADRLRITANDKCISCGECSRYCQVGIDVMRFANYATSFGNKETACIQCGICITVCPMDVLKFERKGPSLPVIQPGGKKP